METLDTSLLEWGGGTKLLSGCGRNEFCKIVYHFGGTVSAPTDLADFFIPFVSVLIGFSYSAHVSFTCLVVPL